ncbi:MAG TPA: propionyl-CoA synthetase, partial [Hyphomonas sp.]|nr:propionyl-CoA synthetase [Hyphomonas sp.]
GDRVLIYMPMVPEAVIAMLATARIGAVHVVVFGGFAARELATRIEDATPRIVLSASCGLEPGRIVEYKPLLDEAIRLSPHKPECSIIFQRSSRTCELEHERDFDWAALVETARTAGERAECVSVASTDPLYILHTSGTTGKPKGIVRDHGGYAVALKWSMEYVYNVKPGEVFWAASDVGWVVGHSYIVYGPLLNASTTILFEGKPVGTPDAATFWRVIERHRVNTLFTAPTAFRAIKKVDPAGSLLSGYDHSGFRQLFLAGERADPDTIQWAERLLDVPVVDHWWQTETGWPIAANPLGIEQLPTEYGSSTVPMPGFDVRIVDESGSEMPQGGHGAIVIKLPLPPGCLLSLWDDDESFLKSYFEEYPGYYKTGDAGYIDDKGYIFVMSRVDDIINVAGHRLSTGAIEEVVAAHPDVAECAVIGVADSLKGELPIGLIVLNDGVTRAEEEITREIVNLVRTEIGPVTAFKRVIVVDQLPKTRSGKILRKTIKSIAESQDYVVPATIDDPQVLNDITSAIAR